MKHSELWKRCMAGLLSISMVMANIASTGTIAFAEEAVIAEVPVGGEYTPSAAEDEINPDTMIVSDVVSGEEEAQKAPEMTVESIEDVTLSVDSVSVQAGEPELLGAQIGEETETETETETESESEVGTEPESDYGTDAGTESVWLPADETEVMSEPLSEMIEKTETEAAVDPEEETEVISELEEETETAADPEEVIETESETETITEAGVGTNEESEAAPELEEEAEEVTVSLEETAEFETEIVTEAVPFQKEETASESEPETVTESFAELEIPTEEQLESEEVMEADSESEAVTEAASEEETEAETMPEVTAEQAQMLLAAQESDSAMELEYSSEVNAIYGESAVLTVNVKNAAEGSTVQYKWYKSSEGNENVLSNEASYTVSQAVADETYCCEVTDGTTTETAWIWLNVDSKLKAEYDNCSSSEKIALGGSITLGVRAESLAGEDALNYQWYKYENGSYEIEGENRSSYTVTSVTEYQQYYCSVSDGCNNINVWFYVSVDSGFEIKRNNFSTDFHVKPHEEAALQVVAVTNPENTLRYQWYTDDGDPIEGAEDDVYTVTDVTDRVSYSCEVSDGYNYERVYFYVYVSNPITVNYRESNTSVTVNSGDSVTLKISASAESGNLRYQWYKEGSRIDGATEATYVTESITESCSYVCYIYDDYGNETSVSYRVVIDSGFSIDYDRMDTSPRVPVGEKAELKVVASTNTGNLTYIWSHDGNTVSEDSICETDPIYTTEYYECVVSDGINSEEIEFRVYADSGLEIIDSSDGDVKGKLGDTVTLWVDAETRDEKGLTYEWYTYDDGDRKILGSSSSAEITIEKQGWYYCLVEDSYNSIELSFYVEVDSGFYVRYSRETVKVPFGGDATLSVEAGTDDPKGVSYQWYTYVNEYAQILVGATEASYTVRNVQEKGRYYCRVSDSYNALGTADFYVTVDSGFSVKGDLYRYQTVKVHQDYTMTVEAETREAEGLRYEWYTYSDDEYEDKIILGTEASCTINVTKDEYYYCTVSDKYNSETIRYEIDVDSGLDYSYGDRDIEIEYGTSATLSFTATTEAGELTYQWYEYNESGDDIMIEGAVGSSYTTEALTENKTYYCRFTDGYETMNVWFDVSINSGLTLSYESSVTVRPGESAELSVTAVNNADIGGTISYQWYDPDDNEIKGATESVYTVNNVMKSGIYECRVSDLYSVKYAYIDVTVDSDFSIVGDKYITYEVAVGEGCILRAEAVTDSPDGLSYTWYYYPDGDMVVLDSAEETCELTDLTVSRNYYCVVSDGYNSETITFYIQIDSGLTVSGQNNVYVNPGKEAVLSVTAVTGPNSGEITYQWMIWDETEYEWTDITGETGSSCIVAAPQQEGYAEYRCRVSDDYTSEYFWINVYTRSGLVLNYDSEIYVDKGEKGLLLVTADSDNENAVIAFQWYEYASDSDEYVPIPDATGASLEVDAIEQEYFCRVTDGTESRDAWFEVFVNSSLRVDSDRTVTEFRPHPGEDVTMSVYASADEGDVLTYQWYKYDFSEETYIRMEGAESASCTVENVTGNGEYRCEVSDGYKHLQIDFYIRLDSGLTVETTDCSVEAMSGSGTVLSVTASADYGTLAYQWYREAEVYDEDGYYTTWIAVKGAAGCELSIENVTDACRYKCEITNGYENRTVTFMVYLSGSAAPDFESAKELTLGSANSAVIAEPGSYMYFRYIPLSGGIYSFYSTGAQDTYGYLYDAQKNELTANDDGDGGVGLNFKINYELRAGQTYYLGVRFYNSNTTGSFKVMAEAPCEHRDVSDWIVTVQPTCTSTGTQVKRCTVCETVLNTEVIPKTAHQAGAWEITKAATCTSEGSRVQKCTVCETVLNTEVIPKTAHQAGAWEITKAATCTSEGSRVQKCTVCKTVLNTEVIPKTAHQAGAWEITKAATCTSEGGREQKCTVCKTVLNTEAIPKTAHQAGAWEITKAATCTSEGSREQKCTVCKTVLNTEVLPKTAHQAGAWEITKAATCTSEGSREQKCTACKAVINAQSIPAVAHKYSAWKTTKKATAVVKGVQTRTCSVCGAKETKTLPKLKATIQLNVKTLPLKVKQSTSAVKVTKMTAGDSVKSWKSSNTKIAAVTSKGKITGKKAGKATITVTLKSGIKASVKVTVQKKAVTTTKLTVTAQKAAIKNKKVSLKKGKTMLLVPTVTPLTSSDKLTYSSSDKKIVTVTSKGKVTAKKAGTAKITVKSGKKKVVITVTVKK